MSDILIKGMEMPKGVYPLVLIINSDGSVEEIVDSEEVNATDAKAIELPPHGELKDADRIAGVIRTKIDDVPCEKPGLFSIGDGAYRNGLKRALGIVANAPTVLEANNGHLD